MNITPRAQEQEEPAVPMAPMIDIIFLLLIFFITTSIYARLENEISITVPTAESAEPSRRTPGEIIVNITREGAIIVNQQELSIDELAHRLQRIAESTPGISVIVRGDEHSMFGRAIEILDVCGKASITDVSFAALSGQAKEQEG